MSARSPRHTITSFKPGQSGNPGGRKAPPKEVRDLAKAWTAQAIATLGKILEDKKAPPSARVSAAESLLNRAWGKPEATVNIKDANDVRDLSTDEILRRLTAVRAAESEAGSDEPDRVH